MVNLSVDLDGGNIESNPTGTYELHENVRLNNPTKDNYIFSHWSVERGNGVLSVDNRTLTIGTQDTTIKANYILVNYTLTFNAAGGSVSPSTKEVTYQGQYGTLPVPTKTNYTFAGWYTAATGGTKVTSSTILNELANKTIYAHYVITETEYAYIAPTTAIPKPYHTFPAPEDGYYKLEVWGASGGNIKNLSSPTNYNVTTGEITKNGGYGGHSVGYYNMYKGEKLYVYVGGQGASAIVTIASTTGGYNGGGNGGTGKGSYNCYAGGAGGGATHIAKGNNRGVLSQYELYKEEILIVAGGGGGALNHNFSSKDGGSGGGYIGNNGLHIYPSGSDVIGGTQLTGYLFGQGGTGKNYSDRNYDQSGSAGSGGGFYGGIANTSTQGGTGGSGGSGYIGNSSLINKHMYCYGCEESIETSTYTINTIGTSALRDTAACPNGYSNNPVSKCAKSGDGYARITYLGES